MERVITAQEMGRIEGLAYEAGASADNFMETAGTEIASFVYDFVATRGLDWEVVLLCGKGNNGGDAYVAGRLLLKRGYKVRALQLVPLEQCSVLSQNKCRAFGDAGGEVQAVECAKDLTFFDQGLILDGVLGTGFQGEVSGLFAVAIEKANAANIPILAIDIPSGVNGNTGGAAGTAIQATHTLYLGLPKTGFFIGSGWHNVGRLHGVRFGLSLECQDQAHPDLLMLTESGAAQLLPPMTRTRHKYQAGYVVGLAGSAAMPGAAVLTAFSALRGGAGIVRMLYPAGMPRPSYPIEVLADPVRTAAEVLEIIGRATACLVGPGLGTEPGVSSLLEEVLKGLRVPCVIDADGLNLLARHSGWKLPQEVILTPHVGEMCGLLGIQKEEQPQGLDWISTCQLYACNRKVTLIVKGAPTFVFDPSGVEPPTVIPRGDPGMATAGCGDVLTGLIAALLSQGMAPLDAARLGAFIHALAGEAAARELTSYSMVASDVTEHLWVAFAHLERLCHAHD